MSRDSAQSKRGSRNASEPGEHARQARLRRTLVAKQQSGSSSPAAAARSRSKDSKDVLQDGMTKRHGADDQQVQDKGATGSQAKLTIETKQGGPSREGFRQLRKRKGATSARSKSSGG